MDKHLLTLYVTGQTPRSQRAIASLKELCERELRNRYELTVVDVLEHPQLAEDQKILATPTVVKELPPPIRRIIGDLSDAERVLLGLDLRALSSEPESGEGAGK
jgi:circadian clock protein KaiB